MEKLATDTDMDVKYFAQEAISGKNKFFISFFRLNSCLSHTHTTVAPMMEFCFEASFTDLAFIS